MPLASTLRLLRTAAAASEAGLLGASGSVGARSPWQGGQLSKVVWADVLGSELLPVTRAEAMSSPAIARARHKVCSRGGRLPLVALEVDEPLAPQPDWLTATAALTSPFHRILWTLDDLVFYGWALWCVDRDDADAITDAYRVPAEWWEFDPDSSGVLVNGDPLPAEQTLLIPGPHEGIVNFASRSVRGSRKLEDLWVRRVVNPVPAVELHQTDNTPLDDEEIGGLVDDWAQALEQNGGAVAYTPHNIDVKTHGQAGHELLVEGRNAAAIDAARNVGVPAAMVDASNVNSTLTYETLQGRNLEFAEDLAMYLDPIAARLSLDDVTPPGTRIAFDTSTLTGPWSPTGPATKD